MAFIETVIPGGASGQGDLTLIFGVGWSENEGFVRFQYLDKQGNEFGGTVSHDNIFKISICIGGNTFSEGSIFSFRVACNRVNMFGQCAAQFWGNADGIYIRRKAGNFFPRNVVDFLDFLKIAAVKMFGFLCHNFTPHYFLLHQYSLWCYNLY